MAHTWWRLFYHVVFSTREREAMFTPPLRAMARRLLWRKAEELGCVVHAIHVRPEHAHLVLSIPPGQAVGAVIGQLKGASSYGLAKDRPALGGQIWSSGYAVLSVGERGLADVVAYVQDQDRRHAANTLLPALEAAPDQQLSRPANCGVASNPAAAAPS